MLALTETRFGKASTVPNSAIAIAIFLMNAFFDLSRTVVIASLLFVPDVQAQEQISVAAPKMMELLSKINVLHFECKGERPDAALNQLCVLVEKHADGLGKHLRIASKDRKELVVERVARYPKLNLVISQESAAEVFRAIVESASWHFELGPDGTVVYDWHRGDTLK